MLVRVPEHASPRRSRAAATRTTGWARAVGRSLLACLPRTRSFDFLYLLVYFVYSQRRLPRRTSGLFNDYLFFMKVDGTLADPLCQVTTDKIDAKHFIDGIVGRKITPETYAVFESVDGIRRRDLPDRCILKPAHAHGQMNVVLEDAGAEITPADRSRLRQGLALDVYRIFRQINYKHLRKRIICEELIGERGNRVEYKLFCYRGAARIVLVAYDDPVSGKRRHNYYDRAWNRLDFNLNLRRRGEWRPRPRCLEDMCQIAERIAAHFEHIRVDLYLDGDRIYVGELTHCHNAAHARFPSIEEERAFSRLLFG